MLFTPLKPMLLSIGDKAFDNEKSNGMDGESSSYKDGERIEAYTKNGMRVTDASPELHDVAIAINSDTAVVDCEGCLYSRGH